MMTNLVDCDLDPSASARRCGWCGSPPRAGRRCRPSPPHEPRVPDQLVGRRAGGGRARRRAVRRGSGQAALARHGGGHPPRLARARGHLLPRAGFAARHLPHLRAALRRSDRVSLREGTGRAARDHPGAQGGKRADQLRRDLAFRHRLSRPAAHGLHAHRPRGPARGWRYALRQHVSAYGRCRTA